MKKKIDLMRLLKSLTFAFALAFITGKSLYALLTIGIVLIFERSVIVPFLQNLKKQEELKREFKLLIEGVRLMSKEGKNTKEILKKTFLAMNLVAQTDNYPDFRESVKQKYRFVSAKIFFDEIEEAEGKNESQKIVDYLMPLVDCEINNDDIKWSVVLENFLNWINGITCFFFMLKLTQNYYLSIVFEDTYFPLVYLCSIALIGGLLLTFFAINAKRKTCDFFKVTFNVAILIFYAFCAIHTPYVAYEKALEYLKNDDQKMKLEDFITAFEMRNPEYLFQGLKDDEDKIFCETMAVVYESCTKNTINIKGEKKMVLQNYQQVLCQKKHNVFYRSIAIIPYAFLIFHILFIVAEVIKIL